MGVIACGAGLVMMASSMGTRKENSITMDNLSSADLDSEFEDASFHRYSGRNHSPYWGHSRMARLFQSE